MAHLPMLTRSSEVDVLVIGAGPTGLGAAKRLHQLVGLLVLHVHSSTANTEY